MWIWFMAKVWQIYKADKQQTLLLYVTLGLEEAVTESKLIISKCLHSLSSNQQTEIK